MEPKRNPAASISFFFIFLSAIFTLHFLIPRHDSFTLGIVYSIAFFTYIWICEIDRPTWKTILIIGIIGRLLLVHGLPGLSDDFYRFIWDGQLLNAHLSPYAFTPAEINDKQFFNQQSQVFELLNSPNYFSVYTPLHQLIFYLASSVSSELSHQVIIMRLFFLSADVGAFFLLLGLLPSKQTHWIGWLFLNPLWMLEGVGNLHIEGILIAMLLAMSFMLRLKRIDFAGVWMGIMIGIKLLPLILLPTLAWRYRWSKGLLFTGIALGVGLLFLAPWIYDGHYHNILTSLSLYQRKFEFNASIYYVLREIGFWYKGYNIIGTLGPALSKITAVFILFIAIGGDLKKRSVYELMLWSWTAYLLLSTTIHPWYILPLLPLGLLSGYFYPFLWSFTIFFSYFGYTVSGYQTPNLWIFLEYLTLYSFIIYEINQKFMDHSFRVHVKHKLFQ